MSKVQRTRNDRAGHTRRRIIDAARELFVDQGYGATKLQEIADHAGVAVQTVYFVFGSKPALLKELVDVTIAGDDEPVATIDRPWFAAIIDAATAGSALATLVSGTRATLERVAAITEMLRAAAATNPEIRDLWPTGPDPRYLVISTAVESLLSKPGARTDVPGDLAKDVTYGVLSPELFLVLTRDRAWSPAAWERWAYDTLAAQLVSGPAVTAEEPSRGSRPG
jgi:AcrR family transcriptional regulator